MNYKAKKLGVTSTMRIPIISLSMQTKIFLFFTLLLAILFLGTLNAEAASVYYVRAGATGANNGSDWSNAYTNLPKTLVRGSTYYVAVGSYGSQTFGDSGTSVIIIKSATAADHGTEIGWSSGYIGQAVWSGWTFNTGYYTLDGQTGGGPTSWTTGFGFKVTTTKGGYRIYFPSTGVSNVTVRHTEVTNTDDTPNDSGFGGLVYAVNNVSYITFSYCYMHHIFGPVLFTGYNQGGYDHWTVEYSKIGDITGTSANHAEIWSLRYETNAVIRYSYIYLGSSTGAINGVSGCSGGCGGGNHVDNMQIYGNIFENATGGAYWLFGVIADASDYQYASNWTVVNNTFVNTNGQPSDNFVYLGLNTSGTVNNVLENNIFWQPASVSIYGFSTEANNSYQSGLSGFGSGDTAISSNPFVSYNGGTGGDYRLTAAVPGVALAAPYNVDMYGNIRGADGVWDRGAFEFGGNSSPVSRPNPPQSLVIQ
jgi:hypothetical protein